MREVKKHMLVREHQLTLASTYIVEQLNRMLDVHDGFDGSAIALPEKPRQSLKPARTSGLHEDQRLFIGTHGTGHDLLSLSTRASRRQGGELVLDTACSRSVTLGFDGHLLSSG